MLFLSWIPALFCASEALLLLTPSLAFYVGIWKTSFDYKDSTQVHELVQYWMTIGESEHRSKIFEISFMEVMLVEDCWDDLTPSITNLEYWFLRRCFEYWKMWCPWMACRKLGGHCAGEVMQDYHQRTKKVIFDIFHCRFATIFFSTLGHWLSVERGQNNAIKMGSRWRKSFDLCSAFICCKTGTLSSDIKKKRKKLKFMVLQKLVVTWHCHFLISKV